MPIIYCQGIWQAEAAGVTHDGQSSLGTHDPQSLRHMQAQAGGGRKCNKYLQSVRTAACRWGWADSNTNSSPSYTDFNNAIQFQFDNLPPIPDMQIEEKTDGSPILLTNPLITRHRTLYTISTSPDTLPANLSLGAGKQVQICGQACAEIYAEPNLMSRELNLPTSYLGMFDTTSWKDRVP